MIRTTLVTDGSSDRVLTRIIDWALWEVGVRAETITQWADLSGLRVRPQGLRARISAALELFPCDLLFVHRDAEGAPLQERANEIRAATRQPDRPPHVPVIPVMMQESWLLCDEPAIRIAAGNPNSRVPLNLPRRRNIEAIPDPKELVFNLLRAASERQGRRLQQFNVEFARTLICEHITDFTVLRELTSYATFEAELRTVVTTHGLHTWD